MDPENFPNSNDTDDTSSAKPSFEIDDDDDWSRQVQTDETTAGHHDDSFRMMTSVVESDAEEAVPQPQRELTLKEKLVMRERERRIETERARLKRQFALNHEDTPVAAASSAPESVAETEESIVAHPDEEESAEEARRLGFNMERFLRNSDSFNPQLEPTTEEGDGVLMERFLNEPVQRVDVTRSVSFDMEGAGRPTVTVEAHVPVSNLASFGEEDGGTSVEANTSVVVEPDDTVDASNLQDESSDINSSSFPATDEPRVLRLTEADMQEMAAIEDASIGNAPPSEREEMLSEIGELADFGGGHPNPAGNLSLDTPTTAMESNSVGNQSATRNDHRSLDGLVTASVSSHLSPGGSVNDTVEANPPSERATPSVTLPDEEDVAVHADLDNVQQPVLESNDMLPGNSTSGVASLDEAPSSPLVTDDAYQSLAAGDWSPAGAMGVSPLHPRPRVLQPVISNSSDYGTLETRSPRLPLLPVAPGSKRNGESEPLLSDVPPEIITRREHSNDTDGGLCPSIRPSVDSIFRDARSEERGERVAMRLESEKYAASSILKRAFPDRLVVLTVTLILELPVLFMIAGGSNSLCSLIGKKRYHLLMGFLPLASAMSGNVGLQSNYLTTRAMSHSHVTATSYRSWFGAELGVAVCLGCCLGSALGVIAYLSSDRDVVFALTMMVTQFISIVVAGFTGSLAPLVFSLIFKRKVEEWGGPLETAIQDIVGSFAMVVISYQILAWVGPASIDPDDMCVVLNS